MAISNRKRQAVAKALRSYARSLAGWVRWTPKSTRMRPHAANRFLLGVMFDRSVPWERAWDAAEWMCESIGDPQDVTSVWRALARMDAPRLRGFLRYGYGGQAFHRHYKTFARLLPQASEHILEHYQGDPRRIWNNQRDVDEVRNRLDSIPTIGPGLARMAVLALAQHHGRLGGKKARRHLDPKPDVHVRRVFQRAGLVEPGSSAGAVIEAARHLAPDFPASLDAPAWDIGHNWCRPSRPNCDECPLSAVCPRVGIRQ
jgi:endonuclease III